MNNFWRTPKGQRRLAARQTDEADLQSWLADQPGVVVYDHGGHASAHWRGEVDGHSFSFCEHDTEWDIEIDLHPSGPSTWVVDGINDESATQSRQDEIMWGGIIAAGTTGTTGAAGYGATPRARAEFIVTTIRGHLRRQRVDEVGLLVAERSAELNHRLS